MAKKNRTHASRLSDSQCIAFLESIIVKPELVPDKEVVKHLTKREWKLLFTMLPNSLLEASRKFNNLSERDRKSVRRLLMVLGYYIDPQYIPQIEEISKRLISKNKTKK